MSSGKKVTPDQTKEIVLLREAGWSLATISERTRLSVSTIQRVLRRHPVKVGGAEAEMVEQARQALRERFVDDKNLQMLYAELNANLRAQIKLSRNKCAQAIECMEPTDTKSASMVLRGLTAHATLMKAHSDTVRSLMPCPYDQSSLPELIVRTMTEEDVAKLREAQARQARELGMTEETES